MLIAINFDRLTLKSAFMNYFWDFLRSIVALLLSPNN